MDRRPILKYSLVFLVGALIWGRFFFVWLNGIGEISEFASRWQFYPQAYLLAWLIPQTALTFFYLVMLRKASRDDWPTVLAKDLPAAAVPFALWFWTLSDKFIYPDAGLTIAAVVAISQLTWRGWQSFSASRNERIFASMAAIILIGAGVRLWLLSTSYSVVGSEEAIMGLMARHLLTKGEFSVFLWGQPYMGSLEALIAAVYFFLLGASSYSLKLVPFTFSLAFIPLIYAIGRRTFSTSAGMIAALIIAAAPVFLVFISLFATAYMENLFICGLITLLVFSLLEVSESRIWIYTSIGLLSGVAAWNNLTSVFVLIPAFIAVLYKVIKSKKSSAMLMYASAMLIGALPLLAFNLRHDWQTFRFLLAESGGGGLTQTMNNAGNLLGIVKAIFGFGAAGEPWQSMVIIIYIAAFVGAFIMAIKNGRGAIRRNVAFLFLVLAVFKVLFALTKYGALNEARYALVLYLLYPVFFGALVVRIGKYTRAVSMLIVTLALFVNIAGVVKEAQKAPPPTSELAVSLEDLGIDRIYTGFWTAYQLTFVSKEKIICSSTKPNVYQQYADLVRDADPARIGVLFSPQTTNESRWRRQLAELRVAYKMRSLYDHKLYYGFEPFPDFRELTLPSE